ncbi:MAG: hypothetical protein ACI814_003149 [Mariniblastus sp.]|jgi:hypothetical protein
MFGNCRWAHWLAGSFTLAGRKFHFISGPVDFGRVGSNRGGGGFTFEVPR